MRRLPATVLSIAVGLVAACGMRSTDPVPVDARARPPVTPVAPAADGGPRDAAVDAAAEQIPPGAPVPALAGLLFDERLVVVEPDALALRAIDLPTRRVAWRTAFRSDATGALTVERLEQRVYVHAGNT